MRSTRAAAAVARLNRRSKHRYVMTLTAGQLFFISIRNDEGARPISDALPLDDFVRLVDAIDPPDARRVTKNDIAFQKQLVPKNRDDRR